MTGCPIAYAHPCSSCAQFGNCAPSQAVEKLNQLEALVNELKEMVMQMQKPSQVSGNDKNESGKRVAFLTG